MTESLPFQSLYSPKGRRDNKNFLFTEVKLNLHGFH